MGVNFISRYDRGMREMAANLLGNGSRQRPDIGALDARLLTGEAHVVERAEARAQNGERAAFAVATPIFPLLLKALFLDFSKGADCEHQELVLRAAVD